MNFLFYLIRGTLRTDNVVVNFFFNNEILRLHLHVVENIGFVGCLVNHALYRHYGFTHIFLRKEYQFRILSHDLTHFLAHQSLNRVEIFPLQPTHGDLLLLLFGAFRRHGNQDEPTW